MPKTIMIVDDAPSVRQVLGIALRSAGYDVVEATNGQDATDKLDGRKLHLVICDLNMPVMDGLGFLESIRGQANYRFTPVIMLTTEIDVSKKSAARLAGAKAWLTKPFQPSTMLDAVAKICLP
jgi:two-component system chemotaxis response regulator CheY